MRVMPTGADTNDAATDGQEDHVARTFHSCCRHTPSACAGRFCADADLSKRLELVFGKDEPKSTATDRTVEAGWVPQWMVPMIVDELNAQVRPGGDPDDFNLHPYMKSREPMARVS